MRAGREPWCPGDACPWARIRLLPCGQRQSSYLDVVCACPDLCMSICFHRMVKPLFVSDAPCGQSNPIITEGFHPMRGSCNICCRRERKRLSWPRHIQSGDKMMRRQIEWRVNNDRYQVGTSTGATPIISGAHGCICPACNSASRGPFFPWKQRLNTQVVQTAMGRE